MTSQSNLSLSVETWKSKKLWAREEKEGNTSLVKKSKLSNESIVVVVFFFQMCLWCVTSLGNIMSESINPRISLYFRFIAVRGVKIEGWIVESFLKNSIRWWVSLLQNLIRASHNQCSLNESELASLQMKRASSENGENYLGSWNRRFFQSEGDFEQKLISLCFKN